MKRSLLLACLLSTLALPVAANDGVPPTVNTTAPATDRNAFPDGTQEENPDLASESPVVLDLTETAKAIEKVYPGLANSFDPIFKDAPFGSLDASMLSASPSGITLAFLLPPDSSALEPYAQSTLKGVLAANYRRSTPHQILLIRPDANTSILDQVNYAADQGATVVIGPLDRNQVDVLAQQEYLPLPVITLNEVDLYHTIPYTDEEIAQNRQQKAAILAEETNKRALEQLTHQAFPKLEAYVTAGALSGPKVIPALIGMRASDDYAKANAEALALAAPIAERFQARIAAKTSVPGLILSEDVPENYVRHTPRVFPRELLMMSLSMENDARRIARLAVEALPRHTETGQKPKVLLIDQDSPLEKRIAKTFLDELVLAGHTPDILTVNLKDFRHLSKFFELVVDIPAESIDNSSEEEIDKEKNPTAWRQQQLRLNRELAERRAAAALAEPPYHAVLLALNAKTASLVRSRLPIRTRVWSAPLINPGDPTTDSQAKAMTYDLRHVSFIESPFVLHYDAADVEERYRVPAPAGLLEQRLFSLGVDAFDVAERVAHGHSSSSINGLLGRLSFDTSVSPLVERHGQTAMIFGGQIKPISEQRAKRFQLVKPGTDPLAKFRKLDDPKTEMLEPASNAVSAPSDTPFTPIAADTGTLATMPTENGSHPVEPDGSQIEPTPDEPVEPIELLETPIVLKPASDAEPYKLPEDYVPIATTPTIEPEQPISVSESTSSDATAVGNPVTPSVSTPEPTRIEPDDVTMPPDTTAVSIPFAIESPEPSPSVSTQP